MLTLLLVWASLVSYCFSVPLPDQRAAPAHIHKHKHFKTDTLALKTANAATVSRYVRKSMCTETDRKQCSAKCCSKRCKTEGTDENLVSCTDLHRMIVELKERIAKRKQTEECAKAEKSDTVSDKSCEDKNKCQSVENAGNSCCGNAMETACSPDCPPTVYDDCGDCKNDTRGEFDNCGDDCDCCDANDCGCDEDAPDPEDDGQYKEWKCLHDESECGQDNIRNPPIDDSVICNHKRHGQIDTHEHHHYHHHSPCCIAVNHKHVNIHHHDHHHHHCHCIGCPCQYNNYKCTPMNKEGGGGADCCGGVQRDSTNATIDASNATIDASNATGGARSINATSDEADGGAPADNANNLLRCTSIYHMIDELKGEINAQANATASSDKTGEARCFIYKDKTRGMWACNDEKDHDHMRHKHKIRKFYGDGKNKKHMHTVRKVLTQFLSSWLHPSNKTKSSMH